MMVDMAIAAGEQHGVKEACRAFGVSRSTFYRRRATPPEAEARPSRSPGRKLSAQEEIQVLDLLAGERFMDDSIPEIYASLLDEGVYICSQRTMYRVAAKHALARERRDQLVHPAYSRPELLATGPNQVWSWDITKLRGPRKWSYYYLYVVIDIYSRCVVAWMVAERESATLAERMIRQACETQGIAEDQLTIHADRGSAMRSKLVAQLLADLGITKTHSRPHTSNDNPYSEAQFKTLKYHHSFPDRFGCLEDARTYLRRFFEWYNREHRHSGIGFVTPESLHTGQAHQIREKRQEVLARAYLDNPQRFVKGPPSPPPIPSAVWINKPAEQAA